ncbi:hypothetical protein [Litchfieldella qijiaojingensis]|uniref:hypothetical protein n=1 Tax=Litchfieldella qijiaojingensis TaxID=980347 RepID=UPI001677D628|nr:hypothetical protein [Halomonas qijiaojingensis]
MANALQSVSPTLGRLSSHLAEKRRKEAEQQAQAEIQQMSMEEAEQLVQSGEMSEYENPYFQEAFQRQYGVRLGLAKGRELKAKFATGFNARSDDVDQFIAENLGVDMGAMAQNPTIQGGFTDAMEETMVTIRDEAAKQQAAAYEQDKLDGVYETFTAELDQRISRAETPEQRKAAINEAYQAIRSHYPQHQKLLNLSNAEQDAVLMQVASKYARDGQADVVEKLLTDNRGGIGAIIDKRGKVGSEAASILRQAEKNYHSDNRERTFDARMRFFEEAEQGMLNEEELLAWHEENPGALTEGRIRSLFRSNRSAQEAKRKALAEQREEDAIRARQNNERAEIVTQGIKALRNGTTHRIQPVAVTDDNGELEMMSKEDQLEAIKTELHNTVIPRYASQFPEEEQGEAAFNYALEIYSKNPNLVNDQWKATLENAPGAVTAAAATDGDEIPTKLKEGYALYNRLRVRNPGLLNGMITEKDRDVYEAIRIGEQYMGLPFERSVSQAHRIATNQDIEDNPSIRARYDEVDAAVESLNGWVDGWGDVKNDSYVSTELRKIGRHIARAGGSTGLDQAVERFKSEHEFINGWAVPTRGQNVPVNFKELAEKKINEYVEKNSDEGMSEDDITVFPLGGSGSSGVWTLVDQTTASPLSDPIGSTFTLDQLMREDQEERDRAAREALREQGHTSTDGLTAEEMNAAPEDGEEAVDLGHFDSSTPARLPTNLDPKMRQGIETLRDAGITQSDFDRFLEENRREPTQWAGLLGNGKSLNAPFATNPTVRETIRQYLPTS